MLQNKFLLLFLIFFHISFSQEKKVDTVYVYEEVIIHDTIYIEKPIDKIKLENIIFKKSANDEKGIFEVTQNGKIIQILVDSTNIVLPKIKPKKSWFFGGRLLLGTANNSFFNDYGSSLNLGIGLGIWVRKQIFSPNFFIGTGFDALYFSSPFSIDATQNQGRLNGYYFVNNNPYLFKNLNSKHFQVQVPLQFHYKIKKFMPSIGFFAAMSNYKSQFVGSSGNLPIALDETKVFEAKALQFGYLTELQYSLTPKISVGLSFYSGAAKNFVFTDKNDKNQSFKTQSNFNENRFLAQLTYNL